jgi:hypothetical protein
VGVTYGLAYVIPLVEGRNCLERLAEFAQLWGETVFIYQNLDFVKTKVPIPEIVMQGSSIEKEFFFEVSSKISDGIDPFFGGFFQSRSPDETVRVIADYRSEYGFNEIQFSIHRSSQIFEKWGHFVLEVHLPTFERTSIPVNEKINGLICRVTEVIDPYYGFSYCDGFIEGIVNTIPNKFPFVPGYETFLAGKDFVKKFFFNRFEKTEIQRNIFDFRDVNGNYIFFGPRYIGNQNPLKPESLVSNLEHSHYNFLRENILSQFL